MQNIGSWGDLFKNKKITIMGLGLLGSGLGDARFFAESGADLTITDLKTQEQLKDSIKQLKKYKNVKFVLGKHDLKDFKDKDFILKAGGVPLDSEFIAEAEKNKVPVQMSASLFAKLTPANVIGVTGTRGKSTVAQLIYAILSLDAKKNKKRVYLGGNVKGLSTLELLPFATMKDDVVLELDSWRLQGFDGFSSHVSVFTNLMPDHMNYYKNDMARYFADKANIYKFQTDKDILIISKDTQKWIKKYGPKPVGQVIVADVKDLPKNWKLQIVGEHNKQNVALARAATKAMGVSDAVIKKAVESFKAMPGRLELVKKYKGIEIYNDTNATTPEAARAALKSFKPDKKTILIFGGADKTLDTKDFLKIIPEYVKAGVVLPGSGTDKIKKELEKIGKKVPLTFVKDMRSGVAIALARAKKGDRIILSPGFASFGLFKNEYDRGEQFDKAVKGLK